MTKVDAFFLHAAPDNSVLDLIKKAYSTSHDKPFYIFVSASWEEFKTNKIPSNFRSPKIVGNLMKNIVPESIYDILKYIENNKNIHVVYTSIPRECRPFRLEGHEKKNIIKNGIETNPECLFNLFENEYSDVINFDDFLSKYAKKGTFLADVLSVLLARSYIINENMFQVETAKGDIELEKVESTENELKVVVRNGENCYGKYFPVKCDNDYMKKILRRDIINIMNCKDEFIKIFENVYVFEDPLLNDVDDIFASNIIEKLSKNAYKYQPIWLK